MQRNKKHLVLSVRGEEKAFAPKGGGSTKRPGNVANRATHAAALLHALDHLPTIKGAPGVYLDISGRPGEPMITTGLDASDLTLLHFEQGNAADNVPSKATVFATPKGIENLRKKIDDFSTKNRPSRDGSEGAPFNADLVQSMGAIVEAGLRALWRSPDHSFPTEGGTVVWEVWLEPTEAAGFISNAAKFGVVIGNERLDFPEDIVVVAMASRAQLAMAIRRLAGVRALAAPSVTAENFDCLEIEEQSDWTQSLLERATFNTSADANYITLLDRGVSRAHPLIQPALAGDDRHAANPEWAIEDNHGHGTQLAGLALFGDLTTILQLQSPIVVAHRLESVKIIPDDGQNPHHLLGAITQAGINAAETAGSRRRTFAMASTTEDDTPHDGAPTSWSSAVDQLTAGVAGTKKIQRLMLVSAGNTLQNLFIDKNYLPVCEHPDNEIESPAQAWNAISVGAYTTKNVLPEGVQGAVLAPVGDLSPSSRTASWISHWPIKPDVVFEGGNWVLDNFPPPAKHRSLSLLTTDHQYPLRSFTTCCDTSAATALAAKEITELWAEYPDLWPETIRALFVSSARWTPQMLSHLPANPNKAHYDGLFRRYGFGVPDLARARRSASNALTLIVEDTITPYRKSEKASSEHIHNEMKIFELPWPVEELRKLKHTLVRLRVALSTFIIPNPSEPARGSKFRYASHNLRFKLNRPNEKAPAFLSRISKIADKPEGAPIDEYDGWTFGQKRRDVGSLQIDELECYASDLARRNLIAVHPVSGWWKTKTIADPGVKSARFALIIEIDAGQIETDLYAEVQTAIENLNTVATSA